MMWSRATFMRLLLALLGVLLILSLAVLAGADVDDGGVEDAGSGSYLTPIVGQ